jgi:serine/threonine protein phosphatase PrpC
MIQWIKTLCSEVGKKDSNQDFVAARSFSSRRRKIDVLIACDGVGGHEGGAECSAAVGNAVLNAVENFLARRKSDRALDKKDLDQLRKRITSLPPTNAPEGSATTLALVLFDRQKGRLGYSMVTAWVGDSHIHLLEVAGSSRRLTNEHHDDEGRLTHYVTGSGRVHGGLEMGLVTSKSLYAICLTTDGIHEKCRPEELYNFLLYCIDHKIREERSFSEAMTLFLGDNIDDNYSAVLLYRPLSDNQVIKTAAMISS